MNEPFTTAVPPPPMPVSTAQRSRSLQIALFVAATLWFLYVRILAANAANSLGVRYDLGDAQPLIEALLLLLLLLCGLVSLRAIEGRLAPLRQTLGLPKRETSLAEWGLGAAIGWGLAVAAVVPMALARTLNTELWTAPRAYSLVGFSLLTLAVTTLAYTLALFGYGFQRLIEAAGPTRATLILAALTAIHGALTTSPTGTPETTRILIEVLAAVLLALGWMRTHGLWLIWG
jgi:hypothetical protein